jgi:hypothetical protein
MTMMRLKATLLAALVAASLGAVGAQAQQWHGGPGGPGRAPMGQHYDGRFNHNQFYANRGGFVRAVPGRPYMVGGGRYYWSGGVWYAPRGPGFVVVGPPLGVFVPVLPPYYTTVWAAGVPYYYANDTYYTWDAAQNGYEVVAPPDDPSAASTQAPASGGSDDLYIYPQNNQSAEQQADDKWQCHQWAQSQTGFDPTQSGGGGAVAPDQFAAKRADYQNAMRACLQGRGYSVR